MTIDIAELKASLNKAYRLISPRRLDLDLFKKNLQLMLGLIDEKESEENVKIHLMDFMKNTFYNPECLVATKGKTDFVIHLGKDAGTPSGVLFEVKRPTNKADMVTQTNLNTKAMHELILYYLRERSKDKNNSLTHLVITNIYEWFIFDAAVFERIFNENKQLLKAYKEWDNKQKVSASTDHFYKEIAKPFLDLFDKEISFTYFNLKKYLPLLDVKNTKDNELIPLYKFFTPVHLLKLPFLNDSNSLDKGFFSELLHIIGLEEVKDGGRKIIRRLPEGKRHAASLIENTIEILNLENAIRKVPAAHLQGDTAEEQLFNAALELCITWVNRVLFLKLLEAQLIKYHKGDRKYRFLNQQVVNDYDELYKLFFQVLAKQPIHRNANIQSKYSHIPYLNSSLFEFSDLEEFTIKVNSLDDNLDIELYTNTVLNKGTNIKNTGAKNTLHYLFDFLEAYNFASVGKEEVQEENKTIINAAVLGLVFEKINGYKDGSIYTPGAITTFLCRETIRKAVVKKFNDEYNWQCESIDDLKNYLREKRNTKDILKFNTLINSIKIADPAVGSGHFLVSALNELISTKSELGILADATGSRLSEVDVSIANDELVVTYPESQKFFDYTIISSSNTANVVSSAEQRIQSTLFEEKRHIIEHCLFGVDINPNSVKICRLRLWIELLKHTYYKPGNFFELETLPNIDINIKQGNSLLSKYSLTEDLSEVFRKQRFGVKDYQIAVEAYKEAPNKEAKEPLKEFLHAIKQQFRETISKRDPKNKKRAELRGQLTLAQNNFDLFGQKRTEKEMELEIRRLTLGFEKIDQEIKEVETNVIYKNAFEWRFEFPEALNEKGDFEGFEVIIGNPPYIQLQKMGADADVLEKCGYSTFTRTGDIYCLFYELAQRLLKPGYFFGYITSNKWMRANYGEATRRFFLEHTNPLLLIDFGGYQVFDSATVDTNILIAQNARYAGQTETCLIDKRVSSLEKMSVFIRQSVTSQTGFKPDSSWVILSPLEASIKGKIEAIGIPLKNWDIQISYGIKTGYNEAFIIDTNKKDELLKKCPEAAAIIRPIISGKDIKRYKYHWQGTWIINAHNGVKSKNIPRIDLATNYPSILNYLQNFSPKIEERTDQGDHWSNLRNCAYLDAFEKPKIVWGNLALNTQFTFIKEPIIINNPSNFFNTDSFYLLGFLNSRLADFYIKQLGVTRSGGYFEYKPMFVEQVPIPKVSCEVEQRFTAIVDDLLNGNGNSIELEHKVNRMVFELFNLTEEEIFHIYNIAVPTNSTSSSVKENS
jgi:adenine-specific DNA-methyltransferase